MIKEDYHQTYIRNGQYNRMFIVSGYFTNEKIKKYRDTVVLIQIYEGKCEPFYIDLIISLEILVSKLLNMQF
jgi:hypothetical protein